MRVVSMPDIIHVLEDHLDTPIAASIVLDLIDLWFEIERRPDGREDD